MQKIGIAIKFLKVLGDNNMLFGKGYTKEWKKPFLFMKYL